MRPGKVPLVQTSVFAAAIYICLCDMAYQTITQAQPIATASQTITLKKHASNTPNNDFYIRGNDAPGGGVSIIVRDVVFILDTASFTWTIDYFHYNKTQSRALNIPWPTVAVVLLGQDGKVIQPKLQSALGWFPFRVDHGHCTRHGYEPGHGGGQISADAYDSKAVSRVLRFFPRLCTDNLHDR